MSRRWRSYARGLSDRTSADTYPPPLRVLISVVAHSGDSLVWLLVGGLLWAHASPVARTFGLHIWAIVLVTSLLSLTFKQIFRRPRPMTPPHGFYNTFDRYSFPSGHAVRVGALTVVLGAALPVGGIAALALWSLLVCASRIALRMHFTRDVIVGLLLGWITGAVLLMSVV
ncbi:MAG: phosphatase PAP2 family protein [Anaerolineae bacterium]